MGPARPGGARRLRTEASRDKGRDRSPLRHDCSPQALDQPGAREFLQDQLTTATRFGPAALDKPLDELVASASAERLSEALIGGVLRRDLDLADSSSLLLEYLEPDDFLLRPLPNHLFQRDNSAWVYDGLSVNPMSKPARKRGRRSTRRSSWNFHPMFQQCRPPVHFYYGNDSGVHDPANCEGGDILVIGNGAVMVGMGERTTPQGVEFLVPPVLRPWLGDQGDRRRAAEDSRVHAPRHRDDHDRPRRVHRVPVPARTRLRSVHL